jgi:hypothetical protein
MRVAMLAVCELDTDHWATYPSEMDDRHPRETQEGLRVGHYMSSHQNVHDDCGRICGLSLGKECFVTSPAFVHFWMRCIVRPGGETPR